MLASGKVREIYEIDRERLLFVATDRVSAYDVVLPDPIPSKGEVLTALSVFWFELLDTPHHLLTTDLDGVGLTEDERSELTGRAMVVRRAEVVPLECVVRGYLYGSSWREYRDGGGPTTEHLPNGLRMADRLDEPIFTPATKATTGHDENLTEERARALVGDDLYHELRTRSIDLYLAGAAHAADRGGDPRRHQVRVRLRLRGVDPGRRGAHPRLFQVLAGGRLVAGERRSLFRQAAAARLARCLGVGSHPPGAPAPARGGLRDLGALSRGLPPDHGTAAPRCEPVVRVEVTVTRRPDIADPQGTTIARALHQLGFDEVSSVRVDKVITLDVEADNPESLNARVDDMCRRLLANPVLEDFTVEVLP